MFKILKIYYGERHIAKILSLALNTLIPSFLLLSKALLEVFFQASTRFNKTLGER